MTISRASMQQQLKGNKMKKKNIGGFLETFSPAYSILKGKGPISEMVSKVPGLGLAGLAGKVAKEQRKKAGSDKMKADAMAGADRMSGGGKVVRSKRTRSIDGIASKGKTRGTQR